MVERLKLTPRQERFCLLIVKGETQSTAYEQAGYSVRSREVAAVKGSELVRKGNIAARIAELQERAAAKAVVTLESITQELLDITRLAKAAGSFTAAVAAQVAIAKMNHIFIEQSEVTVMHRPAPLPTKVLELTEDEWLRQFGTENRKRLLQAAQLVNK